MTMIGAGSIVKIHGLRSSAGRKLNGKRAAVLQSVDNKNDGEEEQQERWQVRVELEEQPNATRALKPAYLQPLPRLPLPTGPKRGFAVRVDETLVPKLCELLVYFKRESRDSNPHGDGFQPSDIAFVGPAAAALNLMGVVPTTTVYNNNSAQPRLE